MESGDRVSGTELLLTGCDVRGQESLSELVACSL